MDDNLGEIKVVVELMGVLSIELGVVIEVGE